MFDWLKNIFSHKTEETDESLIEKQRTEEESIRESKQENIARGASDKENE